MGHIAHMRKYFLALNKLEQSYDYLSGLDNYQYNLSLVKGATIHSNKFN